MRRKGKKIRELDREAFIQAYQELAPKIYRHIYLKVSSVEVAQDLTGEVFLKAWQYLLRFPKAIKNIRAFLFKTANNLAIDYYRKKKTLTLEKEKIDKKALHNPHFEDKIFVKEEFVKVKKALDSLREPYRQALVLRYLDELSLREIAKVLKRNPGSISVILHRGLKKLKEKLEKNYEA